MYHLVAPCIIQPLSLLACVAVLFHRVTNHKEKNQLDETYNRWQYMDEKRKALEAWDRRLTEIITGDAPNVIPFRRTA